MIVRSIPGMKPASLKGLSVESLNKITSFIKGEDDEKVEAALEQAAAQEAGQPSGN
jgi:hypothetical protein